MSDSFRVIAIISAFNEGDIIPAVIGHLIKEGIEVYLIDNHSTDDTVQQATPWVGNGLLQIETFPEMPGTDTDVNDSFEWATILRRKEELTSKLQADCFIHHGADEIRESPWPNRTLKEGFLCVDKLGYNCVDFRVFNFPPIDDGFRRGDDPKTYFILWEDPADIDDVQRKAWKAQSKPISCSAALPNTWTKTRK